MNKKKKTLKPQRNFMNFFVKKYDSDNDDTPWHDYNLDELDLYEQQNKKIETRVVPSDLDERPGVEVPEIIWYLIAHYIKPEDVGNFAGICLTTYRLTSRVFFWRRLFDDYCGPDVPKQLDIDTSYEGFGVRAVVIRALYFSYDIFVNRKSFGRVYDLEKWKCSNIWYESKNKYFNVFLKLVKPSKCEKTTIRNDAEDIYDNEEEGARILLIICKARCEVPPVIGMTLGYIGVRIRNGLGNYRMELNFSTSPKGYKVFPDVSVYINDVINTRVLDWWQRDYPLVCSDTVSQNLSQDDW